MMRELTNAEDLPHFILSILSLCKFLGLQRKAVLVITDSGGIQEKLHTWRPCLTVRKTLTDHVVVGQTRFR